MHEIDLEKYNLRTDLIIEKDNNYQINNKYQIDNIEVVDIVNNQDKYITISFKDITDSFNYQKVKKVLIEELNKLLLFEKITPNNTVLIIGLGNRNATPDALGSIVIENTIVTRHLYLLNNYDPRYRNTAAFTPGVMGNSGIETVDIIKGIIDKIKPDFVIAIDSLCASSIERINHTIQITNSGIHPGSGIGNNRLELSKKTLGIPIIAIGVPTVVDSIVLINDTIEYLMKKISYLKKNNNNSDKLKPLNKIKYYESENTLNDTEKKEILGYLGLLDENSKKELFYEILSPLDAPMIVTIKEIDFIIEKLGKLIADALNTSLHQI